MVPGSPASSAGGGVEFSRKAVRQWVVDWKASVFLTGDMAVRIEFHPPRRRRVGRQERPSALLILAIASAVVGTHVALWMVGFLG
jgi:hypothetical protein